MSLKENIRSRVNEKLSGRSSKWDPQRYPESSDLNEYLLKAGYLLKEIIVHSSGSVELVIKPRTAGYLHPEITHDITDNVFYVEVKEYGLLNSSDLEEIISGYNTALEVVRYLERVNLSLIKSENSSK